MGTDKSKNKPEGRRREGARFEVCRSCRLEWNVSIGMVLPKDGYICPKCSYRMNKKAETNGKH